MAVHPPGFGAAFGPDLAQPLKEEDAAGIAGADFSNLACDLMGGRFIHPPDMPPELLVAPFSLDRFARLPLFFRHPPHVAIAVLIEAVMGQKVALNDLMMLPDRDHRQVLDIEIHRHRHQSRITLEFHDLLRLYCFRLWEVDRGSALAHTSLGESACQLDLVRRASK